MLAGGGGGPENIGGAQDELERAGREEKEGENGRERQEGVRGGIKSVGRTS